MTITIRQIGATESATATVFWFSVLSTLVTGLAMPFVASIHAPPIWALLVLIGLAGGGAQFMMTNSLKLAPVSVVMPFDYAQLLFASAFGWLIWDQGLTRETLLGACLVIASGLYTLHRERLRHRAARAGATPVADAAAVEQ